MPGLVLSYKIWIISFLALLNAIGSTGYQLVTTSSGTPKQQSDPILRNIEGILRARGEDDSQPTIAVIAHYDSIGAAPSLSYGADSNGERSSNLKGMGHTNVTLKYYLLISWGRDLY